MEQKREPRKKPMCIQLVNLWQRTKNIQWRKAILFSKGCHGTSQVVHRLRIHPPTPEHRSDPRTRKIPKAMEKLRLGATTLQPALCTERPPKGSTHSTAKSGPCSGRQTEPVCNGEDPAERRNQFLNLNGVMKTRQSDNKRMKLNHHFTPNPQMNSTWIKDLKP